MNVEQVLRELEQPLRTFRDLQKDKCIGDHPYFSAAIPPNEAYCNVEVNLFADQQPEWTTPVAELFYASLRELKNHGFEELRIEPSPARKNWRPNGYFSHWSYAGGTRTEAITPFGNPMGWCLKYRYRLTEQNSSRVAVELRGTLNIGT